MSENQGRWNLVKDQSEHEIVVQHINGAVYEESDSSLYGDAYIKFDGENDYLYSDDTKNFEGLHIKNNDFTFETWFRLAPLPPTPTPTATPTPTPTGTITPSFTITPSASKTPTPTPTMIVNLLRYHQVTY